MYHSSWEVEKGYLQRDSYQQNWCTYEVNHLPCRVVSITWDPDKITHFLSALLREALSCQHLVVPSSQLVFSKVESFSHQPHSSNRTNCTMPALFATHWDEDMYTSLPLFGESTVMRHLYSTDFEPRKFHPSHITTENFSTKLLLLCKNGKEIRLWWFKVDKTS